MTFTILSVAYPLAPVSQDAVGGAEQMLSHLDHALVRAGHRSLVVASEVSHVAGALIATPAEFGPLDESVRERAWARHREAISSALERFPVDLVHVHGHDFHGYLPPNGVPTLVTLHVPHFWYASEALTPRRPRTWLHGVSVSQHRELPQGPWLLPPIENGVPVGALQARHAKRPLALMLARICPEKGVHLAIDAAKKAGIALLIAGSVYEYPEHRRYFREEVEPRLDAQRRFIGPVDFRRKRRLLTAAQCVLVPSLVPETSSLVAREALACGTPVIAFRCGALPETVEDGVTGFLVDDADGMANAIRRAPSLDPEACRRVARERFSLERMAGRYFEVYRDLVTRARTASANEVAA
jgi:glycosyltransferase involved in cell wall biosynthesis